MTMWQKSAAICAAVITKPTIRKVTNVRCRMTTNITELAQSEINDALAQLKQISEYPTPSTQYARVLRKYITSQAEALEKAQQRIAELESRTVKLPAERFCPAEYAGSQLWSETEVWNKAITACADALRADGIKVEAE
ncbi:hypothetical protein [Klebsiella sp. C230]|uniref:hypothetical protein n=2 Tax=Klebsiella TaxID=570 RepID=UPI0006500E7F